MALELCSAAATHSFADRPTASSEEDSSLLYDSDVAPFTKEFTFEEDLLDATLTELPQLKDEQFDMQMDKELYCLAVMDDDSGVPLREVTDQEAEDLARVLASCSDGSSDGSTFLKCPAFRVANDLDAPNSPSSQAGTSSDASTCATRAGGLKRHGKPANAPSFSHKSGGPCDHCRATESPQWRRGPKDKPMLCNACGTRYRRTHQLGPPVSSHGRGGGRGHHKGAAKRSACAKEVVAMRSSKRLHAAADNHLVAAH